MSKIFKIFCGDYVRLTLKRDSKGNIEDGRGNIKLLQTEMQVQGYLADEDDDYFYLSYSSEMEFLSMAVSRKEVVTLELCDPSDENNEMAELLDQSVGPEDTGVN